MSLKRQALERAAVHVRVAIESDNEWISKSAALRACEIISDHKLLIAAGESLALLKVCGGLIHLAEVLVTGCEHVKERKVCGVCARQAHSAIVNAKRIMERK